MTTSISIHPQTDLSRGSLRLAAWSDTGLREPYHADNGNAVVMRFTSLEDGKRASGSRRQVETIITAFYLSDVDAEALGLLLALSPESREKILPALRHARDIEIVEREDA